MQEIRAVNSYLDWDYDLFYWRTSSGLEVDFILYGPRGLVAIEVKRKRKISSKYSRALREFKKDYPSAKCYILYGDSLVAYENDIQVVPIKDFLQSLDVYL